MRWFLLNTVVLGLSCLLHPPAQAGNSKPADFRKWHLFASIVAYSGDGKLILVGPINEATPGLVREALDANKDIKVVLVDSPGGNLESAMGIAALIRKRRLDIVVDGMCFSACANYIFPAGVTKTVLPGSVVGIHQNSISVIGQVPSALAGQVETLSMRAAEVRVLEQGRANEYYKLEAIGLHERRFYADFGVAPSLQRDYAIYAMRHDARQTVFGDSRFEDASCPNVDMWVLDKVQLKNLGIKGIGAFWYPRTQADWRRVAELGVPTSLFFHGTPAELDTLCRDQYKLDAFPAAQSFSPALRQIVHN